MVVDESGMILEGRGVPQNKLQLELRRGPSGVSLAAVSTTLLREVLN